MIYLDNAATTWPKPNVVVQAVAQALREYGANPGRSGHAMGMAASLEVFRCRETAAQLFHADNPSHVVFTQNCTMSLNMVLKGLLREGDRVVVSSLEHNAVMRPLHALSPEKPVYDVARVEPGDDDQTVKNFRSCIGPKTRAIVCLHASNVFGVCLPIRRIGALAAERGIPFVVDGAQTAGVIPVDMQKDGIDFLCLPGHKGLYGPMGTGLLLSNGRYPLSTLMEGGTGNLSMLLTQPEEWPEHMESGTVNVPGICGLRAGMELVMAKKVDEIQRNETALISDAYDRLRLCPEVLLYTARPALGTCAPVLALNARNVPSEELAARLNRYGVAVRAGLHCAPAAHQQFGTLNGGTVRLAPSIFTTSREIETVCHLIEQCARK